MHWSCFHLGLTCRTSGPSVAGLETTYSGGNGFSTSYNSQRWLNLYLSACKLLDLVLALPSESLPQFQMCVLTHYSCLDSYTHIQYIYLKTAHCTISFRFFWKV